MNKRGGVTMRGRWIKVLAAGAALAGVLFLGWQRLQEAYVFWSWSLLPRDSQALDISGKEFRQPEAFLELPGLRRLDARNTGMTLEQYEWLSANIPQCYILWDIPVQGTFYSQETREISVEQLTASDIRALQHLENLTRIDTGSWQDHAGILALQEAYPDCTIHYRVALGGELWDWDAGSLTVENADPEELLEKLPLFPALETVELTGTVPEPDALHTLQQAFPEVLFQWQRQLLGQKLESDMAYLDLSGAQLQDTAELEILLPLLSALKTVRLDDSGLTEQQCIGLAKQFPQVQFIFDVTIGEHTLRTDATEIDISNTPMADTSAIEALLPCFRDLEKVVMCSCGISSEDMDALDKRHDNIRFVWSVELAGM